METRVSIKDLNGEERLDYQYRMNTPGKHHRGDSPGSVLSNVEIFLNLVTTFEPRDRSERVESSHRQSRIHLQSEIRALVFNAFTNLSCA